MHDSRHVHSALRYERRLELIRISPGKLDSSAMFLEDPTPQSDGFFLEATISMMQSFPNQLSLTQDETTMNSLEETQDMSTLDGIPICWDHDCNGRVFSSWSNLRRHQRERASQAPKCYCPRCGAHFSRTTARNQHLTNMSCKRIRRYSNGRVRPSTWNSKKSMEHSYEKYTLVTPSGTIVGRKPFQLFDYYMT